MRESVDEVRDMIVADAPRDFSAGDAESDAMPPELFGRLAGLGLI